MSSYVVAIVCVFGLAVGQVLFKLSAVSLKKTGSLFAPETCGILLLALGLYGVTTLAWVWVLQRLELSRAYPLSALAYVFVPIASYWWFNERIQPQYVAGVALIVLGVIVTVRS